MPLPYDSSRSALYCPDASETVFADGAAFNEHTVLAECARLAYYRAEVSEASKKRLTSALALVGFGEPTLFADAATGTFAFGALRGKDGAALIAFRGTQPDDASDIATDLAASWEVWQAGTARVHKGFAQAFRSVQVQIEAWLKEVKPRSLLISGHSLGGALATLAASLYAPILLFTLGSPRVGDSAFCASVAHVQHHRYSNCCDIVTRLPPHISGYCHCGDRYYIDQQGQVHVNPVEGFVAADRTAASLSYVAEHAWRIGSVLLRDLADHAPVNYLRAIF